MDIVELSKVKKGEGSFDWKREGKVCGLVIIYNWTKASAPKSSEWLDFDMIYRYSDGDMNVYGFLEPYNDFVNKIKEFCLNIEKKEK